MADIIADKSAPRMGKKEFSIHLITKELYKKFINLHPEYKSMKYSDFKDYWEDIAFTIRSETVMNPLGVKLHYYLGETKTQFLPYKFKSVNIDASIEAGELIGNLNISTRGKVAKIKWERRQAVRFNKVLQFYGFEPDRKINTLAAKYVPENPEKIRTSRVTLGGKRTW